MLAKELLNINLNEYKNVILNSVYLFPGKFKIVVEEVSEHFISVLGFIDESLIIALHFREDEEILVNIKGEDILINSKEEKKWM